MVIRSGQGTLLAISRGPAEGSESGHLLLITSHGKPAVRIAKPYLNIEIPYRLRVHYRGLCRHASRVRRIGLNASGRRNAFMWSDDNVDRKPWDAPPSLSPMETLYHLGAEALGKFENRESGRLCSLSQSMVSANEASL